MGRLGLLVLVVVGGCAMNQYERNVRFLEEEKPNRAQLARGDLSDAVSHYEGLQFAKDKVARDLMHPEPWIDRLTKAAIRYAVDAAGMAGDPMTAISVAIAAVNTEDPQVLAILRDRATAASQQRRQMHATEGTWFVPRQGEERTTSTSIDGDRISQRETVVAVGEIGNCPMATTPFGADSDDNPGVVIVARGNAHLYIRCHLTRPLPASQLFNDLAPVPMKAGRHPSGVGYVDFEVDVAELGIPADAKAKVVGFELHRVWAEDNMVVIERGRLRLRPDVRHVMVANGTLIWLRD